MESALRDLIIGNTAILGLVAPTSVVWNHLPQATPRPAIVLYRISGAPGLHMRGSDNLINATVQIDIHVKETADVPQPVNRMFAIRDALLALLHGHSDETLRVISATSERQTVEELAGVLIHRCSMDWDVWARD